VIRIQLPIERAKALVAALLSQGGIPEAADFDTQARRALDIRIEAIRICQRESLLQASMPRAGTTQDVSEQKSLKARRDRGPAPDPRGDAAHALPELTVAAEGGAGCAHRCCLNHSCLTWLDGAFVQGDRRRPPAVRRRHPDRLARDIPRSAGGRRVNLRRCADRATRTPQVSERETRRHLMLPLIQARWESRMN
jgi:hypothetical protein